MSVSRRHMRAGRRLLMAGAVLYLFFVFSPMAEILIRGLEKQFPPMLVPPAIHGADKIVVLSGYAENHPAFPVTSNLSDETVCRMAEGIRIFRQVPGSTLIVSGGVVREGDKPVADQMADFLRALGVPADVIITEGASRNTYENLVEVRKIVGTAPFVLVTSACDLRRAVATGRKLGMNPLPAPACIRTLQRYPVRMGAGEWITAIARDFAHPTPRRLAMLQWAWHEYVGYVWYQLLGRI